MANAQVSRRFGELVKPISEDFTGVIEAFVPLAITDGADSITKDLQVSRSISAAGVDEQVVKLELVISDIIILKETVPVRIDDGMEPTCVELVSDAVVLTKRANLSGSQTVAVCAIIVN